MKKEKRMNRINRLFGILGILAAALLIGALTAAVVCDSSGLLPTNAFYNELGLFSGGYFIPSFAMLINLSFVLLGFVFGALMLISAITKDTIPSTVLGFFGALTGVLGMAHGIFTLNVSPYHYIASSAFYISAAVLCALYVIFKLRERGKKPAVSMVVAVLTCAAGGAYAWYMLSGGMSAYLVSSITLESRTGIEPFALVGWAAIALFLIFTVLYSIGLLGVKRKKATTPELLDPDEYAYEEDSADEDKSLDEVVEDLTDENLEESLGKGLQVSIDESTEDDDHLYGL
jgi:hypothetical protein